MVNKSIVCSKRNNPALSSECILFFCYLVFYEHLKNAKHTAFCSHLQAHVTTGALLLKRSLITVGKYQNWLHFDSIFMTCSVTYIIKAISPKKTMISISSNSILLLLFKQSVIVSFEAFIQIRISGTSILSTLFLIQNSEQSRIFHPTISVSFDNHSMLYS